MGRPELTELYAAAIASRRTRGGRTRRRAMLPRRRHPHRGAHRMSRRHSAHYLDQCPLVAIIRGVTPGRGRSGRREPSSTPASGSSKCRSIRPTRWRAFAALSDGAWRPGADRRRHRARSRAGRRGARGRRAADRLARLQPGRDRRHRRRRHGLQPGYFTPSEAFAAIRAGAHGLKLFPAEAASPAMLKAQLAVIPRHVPIDRRRRDQARQYAAVARRRRGRLRPWRRALRARSVGRGQPQKAQAYVAGVRAR